VTLEELHRRNAELAEAVAARDTFIAVAAHELRNPMTPMIGQVDLLLKGLQTGRYTPEQIEQRLERIRQVMHHYVRRATALLDVSRITTGKFRLEPAPCDLAALVREVVETFADAARYAGSPIGVEAPASLPGTWDRLAMEQIADNLISNAIKYGARRPVEVCAEDLGDRVCLRVRDHGPGISVHDRGRIFGRFERAVGPDAGRTGFGVGLWVVGQLVEAMEGTITVEDAQGGGSVFNVTLPRHAKADQHG
jgi:signal transduction histidine kinase